MVWPSNSAKSADLKRQVDIVQKVCTRQIEQSNLMIRNLERDLNESEDQYRTALRAHITNMDTLSDLKAQRIKNLKSQFDADVEMLKLEFNSERVRLQAQHAKEKMDVLGIMTRAEQEFQEVESDARHEYSSIRDDVKNKNLEEKHALRIQLEATVDDLWRQFQVALNSYNASTDDKKKSFEELKAKDQKNAKEIEQQMKRLIKLQENIGHIKQKLTNNSKDFDEHNKSLKEEKESLKLQFQELKKKMTEFREHERERLTQLTLTSNSTLRNLKNRVKKAEMIMKLSEMNAKLETEEEKIVPFYQESKIVQETEEPKFEIKLPAEFEAMANFHKRFNKVLLDKQVLEKKRDKLNVENKHLKGILRQYLDGITLNQSVLTQPNPLLVVNGKTNAPVRHIGPVNVTYVEAALCASTLAL